MRKLAFGITAVLALLLAIAAWIPRGPMDHGWDWPWHDWWHSASSLQQGSLQQSVDQHQARLAHAVTAP